MAAISIDFGGTIIKLGIVESGQILASTTIPAISTDALRKRLPQVEEALQKLCLECDIHPSQCDGIAIGFPAIVDNKKNRILNDFNKYPDAAEFDLEKWSMETFGLPLALENDARLATIGEWQYGVGQGHSNVVMMTIGTGLGTGVIIENRVLRGKNGQAGCLGGHISIDYKGPKCVCGNIGCAEALASSVSLQKQAENTAGFQTSKISKAHNLDYKTIFDLAKNNDTVASEIVKYSIQIWSAMATNLIHAYDPEILILGGGVMKAADQILPHIQQHILKHTVQSKGPVEITIASLGNTAALAGGQWLINEANTRTLTNTL
ncbi:MAG: ROK family protein [Phycisphaerae bacterium]|nr:ROK family protein [Phycisphaerae bacterium]